MIDTGAAGRLPNTSLCFEDKRGNHRPRWVGQRLVLRGELRWLLRGDPGDIDAAASCLSGVAERLDAKLLELDFGNAVGIFPLGRLGTIEVESRKWSRAHFDTMLAELTAVAAGLPFAAGSQGAMPYDRSLAHQEEILYHAFVYLRFALSGGELLPALRAVLSDPHRRPEREHRQVAPELARDMNHVGIARLAEGRVPLAPVPASVRARVPLARTLGGSMPRWVDELQVRPTVDTPENRFVRAFLDLVEGVIDGVEERTRARADGRGRGNPTIFEAQLLADVDAMCQALIPIRRHGLWQSVGHMVHFPAGSTVLQRRSGYREVLGHFVRLRATTRLPADAMDMRQLLEVKDIALLYELWTFYQLVESIAEVLGAPSSAALYRADDWQLDTPHDLEVRWPSGVRLWYNPRYSPSTSAQRRAYSVPLRPDIALFVPEGRNQGLHLLDAKFRLDRFAQTAEAVDDRPDGREEETNKQEERLGRYKLADLYKMHTYRDAIEGARSVWILYPGSETRFFRIDGEQVDDAAALAGRMLDGVGAIPLRPEAGGRYVLDELTRELVRQTRD